MNAKTLITLAGIGLSGVAVVRIMTGDTTYTFNQAYLIAGGLPALAYLALRNVKVG